MEEAQDLVLKHGREVASETPIGGTTAAQVETWAEKAETSLTGHADTSTEEVETLKLDGSMSELEATDMESEKSTAYMEWGQASPILACGSWQPIA